MFISLLTTIAISLSVAAFEPRQDLSDPAVASSVLTALSSNGPASLSSLTSYLDAGFSTLTGPINSITTLSSSPTPTISTGPTPSSTATDTLTMGIIPGTSEASTETPTGTAANGAKHLQISSFALEGLVISSTFFLITAWIML